MGGLDGVEKGEERMVTAELVEKENREDKSLNKEKI